MSDSAPSFWYFTDNKVDKNTCKKIIELGKDKWQIGNTNKKKGQKYRKSEIYWTNEQWLYDLIWPYMLTANKNAGWKYDIRGAEHLQISKYEKGGHYNWHTDGSGTHNEVWNEPDNEFLHGHVRKISMSLILNSEFKGGELQIFPLVPHKNMILTVPNLTQGSLIFFPSFQTHRISPVKEGTRYSLVSWFVGPPFK